MMMYGRKEVFYALVILILEGSDKDLVVMQIYNAVIVFWSVDFQSVVYEYFWEQKI